MRSELFRFVGIKSVTPLDTPPGLLLRTTPGAWVGFAIDGALRVARVMTGWRVQLRFNDDILEIDPGATRDEIGGRWVAADPKTRSLRE
jgi:hypothetical protein